MQLKNHKQEIYLFKRRLLIIAIFIVVIFFVLLARLFYLQILHYKTYSTLSLQNHLMLLPIEPKRGLIYDRNGVLLVDNKPVFSLDIIPYQVEDLTTLLDEIDKIIPLSQDEMDQFEKNWENRRRLQPITLKLNLTEEETAKFYLNYYRLPGAVIGARLIRYYPLGEDMVSIIGYMGRINADDQKTIDQANYSASNFIGKMGIEKYYEAELHGKVGYEQAEVNAAGRIIRSLKRIPPESGYDLHLTIDSKLQKIAKSAFLKENGALVAIKPNTGEVLALVSNPGFDPNLFVNGISAKVFHTLQNSEDKPMYNRAIRGNFSPGSIIKPFIALKGLDSGVISEKYTINDPGWFQLPNSEHIYHDWLHTGHGKINVVKAIIVSCDTFFYNLAVMLGINAIDDILWHFGFGAKTNIDLPEELDGNIPSPDWAKYKRGISWRAGDTVNAGIGQGDMLATPLQLASGVAVIANRGLKFRPHLVFKMQRADGSLKIVPPMLDGKVNLKNKKNWEIIIKAMQGVINSVDPWGTGRAKFGTDAKYSVAAKTGTAQLYRHYLDENQMAEETKIAKHLRNNSLFIAFAPVDKPEIAIAVVAQNSLIAGNIARKVMDYYLLKK